MTWVSLDDSRSLTAAAQRLIDDHYKRTSNTDPRSLEADIRAILSRFLVDAWLRFKNGTVPFLAGFQNWDAYNKAKESQHRAVEALRTGSPISADLSEPGEVLGLVGAVDQVLPTIWYLPTVINGATNPGSYDEVVLEKEEAPFGLHFHVLSADRSGPKTLETARERQFDPMTFFVNSRIVPGKVSGIGVEVVSRRRGQRSGLRRTKPYQKFYTGNFSFARDFDDANIEQVDGKRVIKYFLPNINEPGRRISEIEEHARTSSEADVVVLPELSISEEIDRKIPGILKSLAQSASVKDDGSRDGLVLLGTFHVSDAAGLKRNVAPVYSRDGKFLFEQKKLKKYSTSERGVDLAHEEDITAGDRLVVFRDDDELIIVLTCIDFCDEGSMAGVVDNIDATLILVPSLGDDKTVRAHERKMAFLSRKGLSCVVLAQEMLSEGDEPAELARHAFSNGKGPRVKRATSEKNYCIWPRE